MSAIKDLKDATYWPTALPEMRPILMKILDNYMSEEEEPSNAELGISTDSTSLTA